VRGKKRAKKLAEGTNESAQAATQDALSALSSLVYRCRYRTCIDDAAGKDKDKFVAEITADNETNEPFVLGKGSFSFFLVRPVAAIKESEECHAVERGLGWEKVSAGSVRADVTSTLARREGRKSLIFPRFPALTGPPSIIRRGLPSTTDEEEQGIQDVRRVHARARLCV